jgi:hypothetical protein
VKEINPASISMIAPPNWDIGNSPAAAMAAASASNRLQEWRGDISLLGQAKKDSAETAISAEQWHMLKDVPLQIVDVLKVHLCVNADRRSLHFFKTKSIFCYVCISICSQLLLDSWHVFWRTSVSTSTSA